MPLLPSSFNADDHEDMSSYDPIPVGEYNAEITESELKLTKQAEKAKEAGEEDFASQGQMLVLTYKVLDGDYKDRTIISRLNLVNPNEKAVEIANKEFATLCRAVGVPSPENSEELHKIPMRIKVGIQEGSGNYGPSNTIKNIKPYEEGVVSDSPKSEKTSESGDGKKRNW